MKKLILLLSIFLITSFAYAADVETGTVAELYEMPYGRSNIYDESELITVWYVGSSVGQIGVSATTVGSDATLYFYEDGQVITATRFGGSATVDLDANVASAIVSLINSDSSGYFKASLGRDATPGTSVASALYLPVTTLASTEADAWTNADTDVTPTTMIKEDSSNALNLRAGFPANSRKTYRLKQLDEVVSGTGTHSIEVWDGETCVWRREYSSTEEYYGRGTAGSAGYQPGVTPLTISFTDFGSKGLAAHKGNNLTVTSKWGTTLLGTSAGNANLSIIVGEWIE